MNLLNAFDERYDRMLERLPLQPPEGPLPTEYYHRFPLAKKLLECYDSGFKCHYCTKKMKTKDRTKYHPRSFSIDHATPLSRGGTHEIENLVFCCLACNMIKYTMTELEFMEYLEKENPDIINLFIQQEMIKNAHHSRISY